MEIQLCRDGALQPGPEDGAALLSRLGKSGEVKVKIQELIDLQGRVSELEGRNAELEAKGESRA